MEIRIGKPGRQCAATERPFDHEEDVVSDVLVYDADDGRVLEYNSRVTPTRGRELGILEQLFGNLLNLDAEQFIQ